MKRFASIRSCLALAVLCCLLLGFSCALAQEEVGFALCDYDPLTSDTSLYARTPTFDYDTEAFYKVVSTGIGKWSDKINVASFGFDIDECSWAYNAMRYDHPELFQVTSMFWYWYDSSGRVTAIRPEYRVAKADLPARQAIYNEGIREIVEYAMQADTTIGRLLRANDYICLNYQYDYDLEARHADTVIETRECVCEGYTALYTAALRAMDIEVAHVLSDGMNHIWNAVKMDGYWYHIDVTWNDPSWNEIAVPQMAQHDNFILSDQGITDEGHYGWATAFTAPSTRYDSAFWKNTYQVTAIVDDVVYYAKDEPDTWQISLYAHDLAKGTTKKLYTFNASYKGYPTPVWVDRNVLYYAHGSALYAMPVTGGTAQKVYQLSRTDRYLLFPFQLGSDLLLYDAERIYDTSGTLIRFRLDGTIRPITPETQLPSVGLNTALEHLYNGGGMVLHATVYPEPPYPYRVMWSSSDPAVAQVDANGHVTAMGVGAAHITARMGDASAVCTVAVSGEGEMQLPSALKSIRPGAFYGVAARCISVPENVESVGAEAFAFTAAEVICLPESLVDFSSYIFRGNEDVILVVPKGSAAERYAVANGLTYVNP